MSSLSCKDGGKDSLSGGSDVDYLFGGGDIDFVDGGDGMDMAFGDHGRVECYKEVSHKLKYATTTDAGCFGGSDEIVLGSGDDFVSKMRMLEECLPCEYWPYHLTHCGIFCPTGIRWRQG